VSWTNGNGSGRAVFIKETISSSETVSLGNSNIYHGANPSLTTSTIASGDWQGVYYGTGTSVKVTGVVPGVFYRIHVCEYNMPSDQFFHYNSSAAIGNPLSPSVDNPTGGQYGYNFEASSGAFNYLSEGATINFSSGFSSSIPLGFTFSYFGRNYTHCKVSSNGFITFNLFSYLDDNLYGPHEPLIAPLWDKISSGKVSYKTVGVSPNKAFVVEWKQSKWNVSAGSPAISFQAWLYENGKVEYIYKDESGPINDAGAVIALVGQVRKHYSLADTSPSPLMDPGLYRSINTKPATNQVYAFTPSVSNVITPTVPVSNVTATDVGMYGMKLNWTKSTDSEFTALFIKETSTEEDMPIQNETYYSASSVFLLGSSAKWQCIYNGTGSSVELTALRAGYNYRIQAFAYNGQAATQKYQTSPTTITQETPVVAPTGNPFSRLDPVKTTKSELFYFLNAETKYAEGAKRAIFIKENSGEAVASPVDNTTYTPNEIFGNGSQIGSTGWFCVFNGIYDGRPNVGGPVLLKVAGLDPGTSYNIHVVDYNGMPSLEKYNTTAAEGNHFQFTTKNADATPYSFTASSNPYTPLSGGTDLNSIEKDYALSEAIDIGFDFTFSGNSFTKLKVSSDGFLTFNPYADKSFYDQNSTVVKLTQDEYMRSVIAPLWGNLEGINGQASYKIDGVAPNRTFTVEWKNWRSHLPFGGPVTISFQAILFETTNAIEYRYKQEAGATPSTSSISAKIGISYPGNQPGKSFFVLNNSSSSPTPSYTQQFYSVSNLPAINQVYRFVPTDKLDQTIDFSLSSRTIRQGDFSLSASASSTLPVTFTSSNPEVATVSGNLVKVISVGKTTITASQVGDDFYNPVSNSKELEIKDAAQTITFTSIGDKTFGDAPFTLSATASSGLPVFYSTTTPNIISISGNTVTIKTVGTATIRAQQYGDYQYYPAPQVEITFLVKPAGPVIKWFDSNWLESSAASGNQWYKDGVAIPGATSKYQAASPGTYTVQVIIGSYVTGFSSPLVVTENNQTITFPELPYLAVGASMDLDTIVTASSGLPVTYACNPSIAIINGSIVTAVAEGTVQIMASQPGNEQYNPANNVFQVLTVSNRIPQTITFDLQEEAFVNDGPITLTATASSGLPVSYEIMEQFVAQVSGNTLTLLRTGTVNIIAKQEGDSIYNTAQQQIRLLRVKKSNQTISFPTLAPKIIGDAPFSLNASASSGLPVKFTSNNTSVVTISGSTATIVGTGTVTITASQSGNSKYNAAVSIKNELTVDKRSQTIEFDLQLDTVFVNDGPITLTATASSGLPVSYKSMDESIATISNGNILNLIRSGFTEITAIQEGNPTYNVAPPQRRSLFIYSESNAQEESFVAAYPNEVEEMLTVDVSLFSKEETTVTMYDLMGRKIDSKTGRGIFHFDVKDYKSGNYVLKVTNGKRVVSKHIKKK
jgi:hypothetical protein